MGTTPYKKTEEGEPSSIESTVRSAIAGHPRGAVRRIVLWVIVYAGFTASVVMLSPITPPAAVALLVTSIALALLMLTDGLV